MHCISSESRYHIAAPISPSQFVRVSKFESRSGVGLAFLHYLAVAASEIRDQLAPIFYFVEKDYPTPLSIPCGA
eukprot:scaffold22637_cov71-Skeletonema_dohrnii-CCMP3373.AAC.3